MRYALGPRVPVASPLATGWVACTCGSVQPAHVRCPCHRAQDAPPVPSWRVQAGLLLLSWCLGVAACWIFLSWWHGAALCGLR